jgi:hypothetical protein
MKDPSLRRRRKSLAQARTGALGMPGFWLDGVAKPRVNVE